MRVPQLSAAIPDMIIAAMRSSGFLADDASADKIRTVDPNIEEGDRDTLAASLSYGGVGGSGGSSSKEDLNFFIDSDDTNSTTPYKNYFRVAHGQNTIPVLPEHEMFTIRYDSANPINYTTIIGPDPDLLSPGDDYSAALSIGAGGTTAVDHYYSIYNYTAAASFIRASGSLVYDTAKHPDVAVGNVAFQLGGGTFSVSNANGSRDRFGVYDVNNWTRIYVGENPGVGDDQLNIEETLGVSRIRHGDASQERTLFISGSYPNITNDARIRVAIGGSAGQQHLDPTNLLIGGGYPDTHWYTLEAHEASFMAVAPNVNARRSVLHTWHRASTVPEKTHLVNHHCNLDFATASQRIRLFSCTGYNGANREIAFEVRADRTAYCGGVFSTAGIDIAENFDAVGDLESYVAGTVMKTNSSGNLISADSYADTAVVGVVSTHPGYVLGGTDPDGPPDMRILIGMAGTVPTNVTTAHGEILVGDLLVSAEDGRAAKAPETPTPGTVIGKALQALEQPTEETKTGTIKMLILNR